MSTGIGHVEPINPGTGTAYCGRPAPYILDIDICAAHQVANFWGLG